MTDPGGLPQYAANQTAVLRLIPVAVVDNMTYLGTSDGQADDAAFLAATDPATGAPPSPDDVAAQVRLLTAQNAALLAQVRKLTRQNLGLAAQALAMQSPDAFTDDITAAITTP